jgi:lauroyl/myristoyl acyltransferase
MSSGNLSRFFQSPINAAIFGWYPPRVLRSYVRALGRLYFSKRPQDREQYLQALRDTFGATRGRRRVDARLERNVIHGIFDHYFEKMLSAYWGYERVRAYLLKHVRIVNADLLERTLGEGRGLILSTGHFGAVEFLPGSLAFRGYPITMVVRYKTRKLKMTMEEIARRASVQALDVDEGSVMPRALAALRGGRIFITELDEMEAWKPTSHKVMTFFGRRVPLDRTVELLHRRTGAPVLLALMERTSALRYQLVLEAPEEHHAAPTGLGPDAQMLKRLEHYVYDHPDHWYIWKDLRHLDQLQPA